MRHVCSDAILAQAREDIAHTKLGHWITDGRLRKIQSKLFFGHYWFRSPNWR
jgi:hypothetical protein